MTEVVRQRSILREAVGAVLLLELLAALLLVAGTAAHERHVRFRAFDEMLHGRAAALLGAVSDAGDAADNVMLDTAGLDTPSDDVYDVFEESGRTLGSSGNWLALPTTTRQQIRQGATDVTAAGVRYRFVSLRGLRVVDPGESPGGKQHHVVVVYGTPTTQVRAETLEAIRFYAFTFALVMLLTGVFLVWFLRRTLSPLGELARAAEQVSPQSWRFHAPSSAWAIRELQPLTRAIQDSVQRLERSLDQQRRFTSDAAHELKTDVAIIKSSLQLLTMRPRSGEEYRRGVARGLQDCERLEAAVSQMLTLARVEHAGLEDSHTSDLGAHASAAVRALGPMAETRGVRLEPRIASEAPVALAARDCDLLSTNLLENAIQHSAPGSAVTVELVRTGERATMTVSDHGEGIRAELLPFVFQPFYRAEEARDRKRGGTGLGLAICKAICKKAGGTIEIDSHPGAGTVVTARLPLAARPGLSPEPASLLKTSFDRTTTRSA